jgi:hypothetical protein
MYMNLQEPLKFDSINLSKIVYPKERVNMNKKIILLKINEKNKFKNFVFQTPSLLNISKPNINNGYAEMEVALEGKEKSKVDKFISFLNNLESKIKEDAAYNAQSWFNITEENQTINFQKIIRESTNYDMGTLKLKIIKNNDFETMLEINNNKPNHRKISIQDIPEDSWCKMILEAYAIWVNSSNDFGIFFRPILVSFTSKEKEIYNYRLVEDSEDEDDNIDIPDTEYKTPNNLFMKIDQNKNQVSTNDTTSQLEINELIHHLKSESESSDHSDTLSEIKLNMNRLDINDSSVLNIDLSEANLSDDD